MHLLMLKSLTLHFINPLVNVVNFRYKLILCCKFNKEVPSLGRQMLHQWLSHPSNELEKMILHSNINIYNHFIEEKNT